MQMLTIKLRLIERNKYFKNIKPTWKYPGFICPSLRAYVELLSYKIHLLIKKYVLFVLRQLFYQEVCFDAIILLSM